MSRPPARVFLVEDDPDFAALIEHRASRAKDWSLVGHAASLAEALEGLEADDPDVVLLDLGLPDSDGARTVGAIVERFHPLAIVVLTGLDDHQVASAALRAGAQDYLDKSEATPSLLSRTVRYARERAHHAATVARQQQELANFATHAAHDLQAPLRSMAAFAQMLEEDLGDQLHEEARECIEHIVGGAERMRTLIADLMSYARSGHDDPHAPVDVMRMLGELHDEFRDTLEESSATLEIQAIPPVVGQETPVRQVLRNLIGNAIKFRGDDAPVVRVSGYREHGRVVIEVADNGIGIPEHAIAQVVQPFARVHGAGRFDGSGLGLSLVDRVVRRHEGQLRIESTEGEGTTIRVDFPCATAEL